MPDNGKLANVKIFKFDPTVDTKPQYKVFNVPYEGMRVLDVLKTLYHGSDPELAFRWGCEGAHDSRCGACAVMVNGRPALSCRRPAGVEMVIEPHPKFEIIRDLVVDFNKIRGDISKREPYVKITVDPEKCVKCADCVSICPVGVYGTKGGEIILADPASCCGETCKQCVTFCYKNAIAVETI